jgi:hypothetical protein
MNRSELPSAGESTLPSLTDLFGMVLRPLVRSLVEELRSLGWPADQLDVELPRLSPEVEGGRSS